MRLASPLAVGGGLVATGLLALAVGLLATRAGAGPWAGAVVATAGAWLVLRRPVGRWARARRALPAGADAWLAAHVPVYARADAAGRARFARDVRLVLAEARFEDVDGAAWTDERRLAVAAGVATLLHGRPTWELPSRRTFLLYPGAFDADYFDDPKSGDFDGMAHPQGPIIFAAGALDRAWAHADGSNVVLHELAHLFDFEVDGHDGVPSLLAPGSADAWAALVRRETQRIKVGKSLLRRYAAENAAEFFAVATEVFFERPGALARRHPDVFAALAAMYALDPRGEADPVPDDAPVPLDPAPAFDADDDAP